MNEDKAESNSGNVTDGPITRQGLYELVWSEPMLKVAARFDVSSSYMARVCTFLNVPRPERGYWAKLTVGKISRKPALPEPLPGDPLVWARDGGLGDFHRPVPKPPSHDDRRPQKSTRPRPPQHHLIVGAKALFEVGRFSSDSGYLRPNKRLLVDLIVSKAALDNALKLASELFLSLEEKGNRVVFAPVSERFRRAEVDEHEVPKKNQSYRQLWSPARCTVVYLGTVAMGLTLIELSEEVEAKYVDGKYVKLSDLPAPRRARRVNEYSSWTSKHDFPTGRFCLQAYSPYWRTNWTQQWRESKQGELLTRIPEIIKVLQQAADEVASQAEEGQRLAELERQRWLQQQEKWKQEEEERRVAKAHKDSKEELKQIIAMWAESKRLEAFFSDAEQRLVNLASEEHDYMQSRLSRARALMGSVDALKFFLGWKTPDER